MIEEEEEYRKCAKCLDVFHVDETDWHKVMAYLICECCINDFMEVIWEMEKKDKNFLNIKFDLCNNCGNETPAGSSELCSYCLDELDYKSSKD